MDGQSRTDGRLEGRNKLWEGPNATMGKDKTRSTKECIQREM